MSTKAARAVGVGVFVVAGLLLFTLGLFMIGDRQMAFAKQFTLYTEFGKITGLQPGSVIRVSGARAGSIKQILPPSRPSEKFRVELDIVESLHPLVRTDSIATIETEGLVGGSYLGIGTGSDTASAAPAGSTIASKEPFEIADLMQQMSDTITKVNDTIDSMKDDLQRAIVSIADTVDNANDVITAVSADVKTMASSGARISGDAAEIADAIRGGKGTVGKLLYDDQLYQHATAIAKQAEDIAVGARQVVEQTKAALDNLQSKNGPAQGLASNFKQTMDDAQSAMAGFAASMDALKHNFLLRGFFKGRGYFDLASIAPADYRRGALTKDSDRRVVRVWLNAGVLFEAQPETPGAERLTEDGKARVDSAISPYLEHLASGVLMVEGYAQQGTRDATYLTSRARASIVRDYLIRKFQLDPTATGAMPLGSDSPGSPGKAAWDGVALAVFLPKGALESQR
jgi:phospholipid/cholesterol/gamma-HCH transport system substrate-binding protein